ncbi:hypothetical protein F442_14548 [Phytophthora nicotianae P10297]|uniref:Uncharacterized protein n=1 Tax=Phytophthora nicotianae P10297 TaxID=1317064 RepID=W2YRH0_PHYNI|nr:hypothetical protein F442_14548 [Phytophthora nicotianae P10297]
MWIMKTWKNLGAHVIKSGFAGLLKCRSGGNPDGPDDTQEPISVEPVNELVEELERLNAVEDAVSASDDILKKTTLSGNTNVLQYVSELN